MSAFEPRRDLWIGECSLRGFEQTNNGIAHLVWVKKLVAGRRGWPMGRGLTDVFLIRVIFSYRGWVAFEEKFSLHYADHAVRITQLYENCAKDRSFGPKITPILDAVANPDLFPCCLGISPEMDAIIEAYLKRNH